MVEQRFTSEHIPTAKEFIELLRLTDSRWSSGSEWASGWYFRGQGDSSLSLLPSAWRRAAESGKKTEAEKIVEQRRKDLESNMESFVNNLHRRGEHVENIPTYDVMLQAYSEFSLIHEFIVFADALGFQTPGAAEFPADDSAFVRLYYNSLIQQMGHPDFHRRVWKNRAVALAQHHGIPTRLLDWTRKPLHAAFFAAEKANQSPDNDGEIAVYALHGDSLGRTIELVTVPRSENTYLHAQDGVFTFLATGDALYYDNPVWPSLETMPDLYQVDVAKQPSKFTLPMTEVSELLRLLSLENISRAHLMPSFDNIALALKTKWQWTSSSRL